MNTLFKALLVSTAVLTSVSAQERRNGSAPQPQPSTRTETRGSQSANNGTYYDSKHRDWHQWNDKEEQSYNRYADEHHQKDRDFSQSSEREQQQYWNWRHKHNDDH